MKKVEIAGPIIASPSFIGVTSLSGTNPASDRAVNN